MPLQGDQYLIKWRGLGYTECTWETKKALRGDQVDLSVLFLRATDQSPWHCTLRLQIIVHGTRWACKAKHQQIGLI